MGEPEHPPLNRRQRVLVRAGIVAVAAVLVGAGLFVLASVRPTEESFYPKCMSYRVLGIHCPGCGTTRALHSLLNGHVEQAFAYNPLIALISPYLLFCVLRSAWFWLWGTEPRRSMFPAKWSWPAFAVLMLYWVLRNVPVYPFILLAPHELSG